MSENAIEWESLFDLYRARPRRVVLAVLAEEQRQLTLNDLTKTIVKYTHHTSVTEVPKDVVTEVQTSLHHIHLPKLAAAGLIKYDLERRRVEPTEQLDEAQSQLASLIEADPELEAPVEL